MRGHDALLDAAERKVLDDTAGQEPHCDID